MQNVALQSIRGGSLDEATPDVSKLDQDVMRTLYVSMEDILIESKLKSEGGPMRSAWDRAVEQMGPSVEDRVEKRAFLYKDRSGGKSDLEGPSVRARSISF